MIEDDKSTSSGLASTDSVMSLPPRHAHLQADAYCEHCAYNLRGQPIHRDEVLGLVVCRCPECGRHHPAGYGRGLTSAWGRRAAELLAVLWVLIVLALLVLAGIGMGATQLMHVHAMSYSRMVATDGREIVYHEVTPGTHHLVYAGTTQPARASRIGHVRTLTLPTGFPSEYRPPWWVPLAILGFAASVSLPAGILMANLLWYWPRPQLLLTLLVPFLAAGVLSGMIWLDDGYYVEIRAWGISRLFFWALVQAGFMYTGIVIGRPVARLLLRILVPPQLRRSLAFLWLIDGKRPRETTAHGFASIGRAGRLSL